MSYFDDIKNYGPIMFLIAGVVLMFISGVYFGFIYYIMDVTHNALLTTSCTLDNNTLVSSCQDLFALGVYPFLALRSILVWISYLVIFGLTIGMLLVGYRSGSSPVLMGMMISFVAGLTYLGILISNVYRTMLENALFRSMMIDFTIYTKIMINFPWFCFFVGIFSIFIGIVNYQKTTVNKDPNIGDY